MARLQVVPLPSGSFGVLFDRVEAIAPSTWGGQGLVAPVWEISASERDSLESQLSEHSEFVVFTTADITVDRGAA